MPVDLLDVLLTLMNEQQLRRHLDMPALGVDDGSRRCLVVIGFYGEIPHRDGVVGGSGEEERGVVRRPGDRGDRGAVPVEVGDRLRCGFQAA